MKPLLHIFLFVLFACSPSIAQPSPEVIFSQEVATIDKHGNLDTGVLIEPQKMPGIKDIDFDLGAHRLLRITTNIESPEQRSLQSVAEVIRRGYDFIEEATGQKLSQGVLLYIIELAEVPVSYSFEAVYENTSQWGEVRLALVAQGSALTGPQAPHSLTSLLYDTLPHELTHAALRSIPQLAHDTNGRPSYYTRWFIEGVCEALAKTFARNEGEAIYRKLLRLRKPDKVFDEEQMFTQLLHWQQQNDNSYRLESDLYGAAMLTMMTWTRFISIEALLDRVQRSSRKLHGKDLVRLMKETTGLDLMEIARHADSYGKGLQQVQSGRI